MDYTNITPGWRDNVRGTTGNDNIYTFWDNDVVYGYEGNDVIDGGQGDDRLFGGDGEDRLFGDNNNDYLSGGDGDDRLDGGLFEDELHGGAGNDIMIGGHGSDRMFGGADNDTFRQDTTYFGDLLDGGTGVDTVEYLKPGSQVKVNVSLADSGDGSASIQVMEYGGSLFGPTEQLGFSDAWTDILRSIENVRSGGEDDRLTGNASANRLDAGGGDDILTGRGGADVLVGGSGNDRFVYELASDSPATGANFGAADLIIGFGDRAGNQDVIDLSAIDANQLFLRGNQAFRLDDGDGFVEIGELHAFEIIDPAQGNRAVTVLAADTNGLPGYDFAIRFDQVIATFDTGDFIF